ncbi:MAG: Collagen triple helix repeat (20 copies) protein [candidate division TM6 bacterium GW2011_GWF2_30_66]|nr:MAG: Collagen triple helix repeat (20 copies) protein [candidate division TM6 bacterium GW2011_GWF2_30_66]
MNVTGAETVGGTLTTLGTVNVAGPLNVTGATNLTGLVTTLAGVNTAGPLNVTGSVNVGGVISASSGTNLAPSITFIGDTDTGFFRDGDGIMGVTSNGTTQFSVSPNLINVASGTKFQANGTVDVVGPLNVTGTTDLRGQVKMSGLVDLGTAISVDMGVYPDATFFKVTPATAALSISGSAPAGRIVFIFNATGVPITIDVPGSPDGTIPSGDVGAVVVVPGEGWKNFG